MNAYESLEIKIERRLSIGQELKLIQLLLISLALMQPKQWPKNSIVLPGCFSHRKISNAGHFMLIFTTAITLVTGLFIHYT